MRDILEFPLVSIAIVNLNGKDYLEFYHNGFKKFNESIEF